MLKMVGKGQMRLFEIEIERKKGKSKRMKNGVMKNDVTPGYMPKSLTDKLHPGGNSLCYQIQIAHLMGCDPIYALGFTLQSGTGYFFGLSNPVNKKRSVYEPERPLHWLRWYESRYPGRVKLWPGWQGPVYEVFSEEAQAPVERSEQPVTEGEDGAPFFEF